MSAGKALKPVTIYTDGACISNPGRGGYGVVLLYGERHRRELSGGRALTTNNRMELMAAIVGLEALKEPCNVTLYSDSRYLTDSITKGSAHRWQANEWWRNSTRTTRTPNADLWQRLLRNCDRHEVTFVWVRGHAGTKENERCDALSVTAANSDDLPPDDGYEPQPPRQVPPSNVSVNRTTKVTREGQPCRACATPVIKKIPTGKRKPEQEYYYEFYLYCPGCGRMFMVEEAKGSSAINLSESAFRFLNGMWESRGETERLFANGP
jgi:ribonuclease HI